MFLILRRKAADTLLLAADAAGLLLSGSGAAVVAFFGKVFLAVVLGALALGFFLRLVSRRHRPPAAPAPTPLWGRAAAAMLAAAEVAVLVEATDLPVRFHQPGFQLYHWLLVLAVLVMAYRVQLWGWRAAVAARRAPPRP